MCVFSHRRQREEGFVGIYMDTNNVDQSEGSETGRIPAFVLARLVRNMAEPLTQNFPSGDLM